MADITKRVNKRAARHLGGEVAEVVLLCEAKGGLGLGALATTAAPRTATRARRKRTAARLTSEGGLAASFPVKTAAVVLTPTRLVAMPSNGLTFEPPTLAVDRVSVQATVVGWRGLGRRVSLRFSDGSTADVDVGPGQPLKRFVALLS